jgi:SRSO17 transposase
LPAPWTVDPTRCQAGGIPAEPRGFQCKHDLAWEMITHARQQGIGFAWVGFDGFYGSAPAFRQALDDQGEVFVGDVHRDQRLYLEAPQPCVPPPATPHGRPPTRRQAQTLALRVDRWAQQQPAEAWQRVIVRDSTTGPVQVDILHRRVWWWDGDAPQARHWHVIIRRAVDTPTEIKYSLSNAAADTPAPRLAFLQGHRYWIARSLPHGNRTWGWATTRCGVGGAGITIWRW